MTVSHNPPIIGTQSGPRSLAPVGAVPLISQWHGDLGGAAQILSARANTGDESAAGRLAELLAERGDLGGLRARIPGHGTRHRGNGRFGHLAVVGTGYRPGHPQTERFGDARCQLCRL